MNLDTGLAVVILAVLVFYLRLIIIQRQRARQVKNALKVETAKAGKRKGTPLKTPTPNYSVVSSKRSGQIIGITGILLILFGVLLYAGIMPLPVLQTYWWVPTAVGIVAFSWLFRL